ncbi:molybdopterin oxidoreductase family protein [Hydrogenimonas cancrithermarum]|uniref:Nitrate reductase catalytic subunit n=1 Tax=Hydrogenimonas cancrithermarum TaxID=2993563 RepID=A0ABM8FP38_9BACT|nr:nitrate reductase [Hydrogenimonas cancrithermarum]BDY13678.1 nitrate reductase catalytic subunit [Hydrogenimonas cancrithermarum]
MIEKLKSMLGLDIKEEKYALIDDPFFGKVAKEKAPDEWVRSTCGYCGVGCGLYIGVKEGDPVYVKGDPDHPVNRGTLCPKGLSEHEMVRAPSRLPGAMIKKNGRFEQVTWDEAFRVTSDAFKEIQAKYGKSAVACISTGQLLTEEFYTLGKFVQLGLETNNYDGNTTLCMASAVMGYKQSFGSDGPPGCYEDFSHAEVIMLIGANIADNHPILKLHIARNKKVRGKKPTIIVVDPRHSKTANMADIYLPIKPRTDLAFINGLCYIIWEQGWMDETFINERTVGYKEFIKDIQKYPPQEVAHITGIDVKRLYEVARFYAGADAAMSAWTMGVNQSAMGTDTVSAIVNLALMTGNLGKPGGSPFSITGQCNAMGTRESGFTSSIPGYRNFASAEDRREYAEIVGVPEELVPTSRGFAYPQIIEAIERGEIKALWVVATNPLVSYPDQPRLRKALAKLEMLVVQDSFMSDTAELADVLFGAATWSEKTGTYTNSERRCNLAKKSVPNYKDSKSDFEIVVEFSKYFDGKYERLFNGWSKPEDAFEEWKKVSKGRLCDYSGMTYEKIEKLGGIQWPCNDEHPEGTPRLYDEGMKTSNAEGKPKFVFADWFPMEENICTAFPLILNTGRTVEQFHTRTKTGTIKILEDLAPEAWVELSPKDAEKLQVKSGDRISLSSPRGRVDDVIVRVTEVVGEGTVFVPFHFNEQLVNRLTQSLFDPKSFEPNYKQTAIQLHSEKVPEGIKLAEEEIAGALGYEKIESEKEMMVVSQKGAGI